MAQATPDVNRNIEGEAICDVGHQHLAASDGKEAFGIVNGQISEQIGFDGSTSYRCREVSTMGLAGPPVWARRPSPSGSQHEAPLPVRNKAQTELIWWAILDSNQ